MCDSCRYVGGAKEGHLLLFVCFCLFLHCLKGPLVAGGKSRRRRHGGSPLFLVEMAQEKKGGAINTGHTTSLCAEFFCVSSCLSVTFSFRLATDKTAGNCQIRGHPTHSCFAIMHVQTSKPEADDYMGHASFVCLPPHPQR
jgi:hypothetical protein